MSHHRNGNLPKTKAATHTLARYANPALIKWLTPGIRIKRWLLLLMVGITVFSLGVAQIVVEAYRSHDLPPLIETLTLRFLPIWARLGMSAVVGSGAIGLALYKLSRSILHPLVFQRQESVFDLVYAHNKRQRGPKVVALGGGTGLPTVLRGLKSHTSNLTAIVTVADDGGSSGALRRELGVMAPGDLRNNIAALANDEHFTTQLFQYRFTAGGLEGHSFGNLFLTAMAEITGGMDRAVMETGRVLAIQGTVLPATLEDNVTLLAEVRLPGESRLRRVQGESQIPESGGTIERVFLQPDHVRAYPEAVRAILNADLIVIGPGSLFTSILPNLLIDGITQALRASRAVKVYVCNVATQRGETEGYSVADHVLALESHIGAGIVDAVLANNSYPAHNSGNNTQYVMPTDAAHPIFRRYQVLLTDLTDAGRPWRHDPEKLTQALLMLYRQREEASMPDQANAV